MSFLFHLYSLSLFYSHHQSQPLEVVYVIIESSPAWQWETPKSYPTTDTQTNKSLSHTIHLPTNHIPIILTTLQQLLVCSLNRYHTIVDHVDDITVHNRAQTMRHCHHRAPLILHALNAVKNVS